MAMTMSDGLQLIRFPKGISGYIPPPGFAPRATLANARLIKRAIQGNDSLRRRVPV